MTADILNSISESGGVVRQDLLGRDLTTLCVGGLLPVVVTVPSIEVAQKVFTILHSSGQKARVIGNGSNLLLPDLGFDSWVIRLSGDLKGTQKIGESTFLVSAGASLMSLSRDLSSAGFSGLEFAGGIPATIGGAIFMNAGAHGGEICEITKRVTVISPDGEVVVLDSKELPWRYRYSGLPFGSLVVAAEFELVPGDKERILEKRNECLAERKKRQPLALPSCGSVFKNPTPEQSAGSVLENAGMKGFSIGGAVVSELHANWIVNPGRNATARDVRGVMAECQRRAKEMAGVDLIPEVQIW